ncbi:RCC1 domain-containing protein, partial [Streptomyces sp. SID6137]|uniref:RCC1-like domain-containing protein n=2 Tax=Streptomyces TaxID=1883 RepID=UPI001F1FBE2B
LPAGTTVTALAGGGDFSLAVTSDGRVLAWETTAAGNWATAPPPTGPHRSRCTCRPAPPSPRSPPVSPTAWR